MFMNFIKFSCLIFCPKKCPNTLIHIQLTDIYMYLEMVINISGYLKDHVIAPNRR